MAFVENTQIVSAFAPVDMSAAANDGDWFNCANYQRVVVLFVKGAGTAGDDPTLTITQASDNSGTGEKALTFTDIWYKQDTSLAATATFTHTTQTAASSYTDATSAEDQAIWVLEFSTDELDVAGGFTHIQASVGDVGTNAQLGCAIYIGLDARYGAPSGSAQSAID
tara:strand:- start:5236 stop:5736 length:501 start_codon:yes stop_codon:yes gene_type:complete